MILYIAEKTDPTLNLALEECFLREYEDEVFMLWQNDKTIVVGKNQNTLSEIDLDYVKKMGIRVVRRITGGGAVYHDMGNLNFTYITSCEGEWESDFSRFATPVISALSKLGIKAELSGRNDITIDGRKFSGNAQTVVGNRLLHHGTILFNTDVSVLSKALTPDPEKIKSKGVKSVSSRVVNLSEVLPEGIDARRLTSLLSSEVKELYGASEYKLSDEELKRAEKLADEKYRTWDWNFGYSPKYTFSKKKRFGGGTVNVFLTVVEGKIEEAKIFGDFFGAGDITDIENALCGKKHDESTVREVLLNLKTGKYFSGISVDELLEVLI
ncbi:MAG: lipoate--protein ligase [Christensenellaceae bacterium]|nr:lipoate--protein ligase [Christensenellaceae bacterium]